MPKRTLPSATMGEDSTSFRSPGTFTSATEGEAVTIAPVGKVHLMWSPCTFLDVIGVRAGLKKRRRGPPAKVGQSRAAAAGASPSNRASTTPRRTHVHMVGARR